MTTPMTPASSNRDPRTTSQRFSILFGFSLAVIALEPLSEIPHWALPLCWGLVGLFVCSLIRERRRARLLSFQRTWEAYARREQVRSVVDSGAHILWKP